MNNDRLSLNSRFIRMFFMFALALLMATASWAETSQDCALTFDTGDENVVVETQLVACGEVPVKPGNPARLGHKFLGWWADKEGNNAFDWTKQLTANVTAYAMWQELPPVEYIDEKGEKKTVKDYLLLTGNESADDGIFTKGGWYVVQGQVNYDKGKFAFSSSNEVDVNLILADGAKLTASNTASFNNLTIYAQSTGENMGEMDIEADGSYAIGLSQKFVLNGGVVKALGRSAGISGVAGVTINGGVLEAVGSSFGIRTNRSDIILGWTDAENDRITAGRIYSGRGAVKIAEGKVFRDDDDNLYFDTLSTEQLGAIRGKTIYPIVEGIFMLTFVTADENVVVKPQVLRPDEIPTNPGNPARVGYKFLGWFADKECVNAFDWTKPLTANTTVYAKWQELPPVEYIDEKGQTKTIKDYLLLTGNESADDGVFTKGGWYVVQGQVTYDKGKFAFSSSNKVDVNLILADGAKLTASNTADFKNLTIYAQSTGENMGQMDIETDESCAIKLSQKFVLNGGKVVATGASYGFIVIGASTINGGILKTTGARYGYESLKGVIINGGVFEAKGGYDGICASDDIVLGWTDAENDRITASSFSSNKGDVKIADGLLFTDGEGHIYHGSFSGEKLASIAGKTLRPDSPFITWSTDESRVVATINGISKRKVKFGYDYDVLADNPSLYADSVVLDREFTPNKFSTLSLPFDFPAKDIQGLSMLLKFNGLKQKEVDGKKRWVVSMKKLWIANSTTDDVQLKAYRPYMLLTDSKTLTFHGPVNFVNNLTAESDAVANGGEAADLYADEINGWTFNSAYSYKMWAAGDGELGRAYGFAAKTTDNVGVGQFVKAAEGAYIYPFRAYLLMNEAPNKVRSSIAGNKAGVSTMSLPEDIDVEIEGDDGDEPKTTVIGKFNTRTGEFRMNDGAARSFDVKGRNVGNNANKARGAYYGKKLVK